jgi:GTP-binding protein
VFKSNKPRVVIAGRPNVGKSTLFNRLTGQKAALVDATPGVTRDSRLVGAELGDLKFELVDTAGLELGEGGMAGRLNELAEASVLESDVVLFMIDGRDGITPMDLDIAQKLRSLNAPCILVMNKCDVKESQNTMYEIYNLGFEDCVAISSAHGEGLFELEEAIKPYIEAKQKSLNEEGDNPENVLPLAIIGRPNAGKSTLVNHLLKKKRMLTGPEAGLTRESVGTLWQYEDRIIELVDTPGVRRQGRVNEDLEKMSVTNAMAAISRSEAVVLMLDATLAFEKQDAILAAHAVEKGKPLIIGLNKWDVVEDKEECLKEIKFRLQHSFSQVRNVVFVPMSALTGKHVDKLLPAVLEIHKKWQTRLGTAQLNRFLEGMTSSNPPPMRRNRRVKIKYMSQIGTEPPTFALFCNMPDEIQSSYLRYLTNGLREAFDLDGIVLNIKTMGSDNPYAHIKNKD